MNARDKPANKAHTTLRDEDAPNDITMPAGPHALRRGARLPETELPLIEPADVRHGDLDERRERLRLALNHLHAVRTALAAMSGVDARIAEADLEVALRLIDELIAD